MPFPLRLILAVAVAVALWFSIQAIVSLITRRRATTVTLAAALIDEQSRATKAPPLRDRFEHSAATKGWTGMLTPLVIGASFLWGVLTLVGTMFTGNRLLSMIVAVPLAAVAVWMIGANAGQRRKAAFDRQLLQVLVLVAGQLEAGHPVRGSLQQATATVDEPLQSELRGALDEAATTGNLIGALRNLATRYPSRAFDLFLTALEIDRDAGGKIEPALRQAADSLQKDFELAQEANAEVAQAKIEFAGILGIMAFIGFIMIGATDSTTRGSYTTPVAMLIIGVALVNFVFGVFRAQSMFRRASGQRPRKLDRVAKRRHRNQEASA